MITVSARPVDCPLLLPDDTVFELRLQSNSARSSAIDFTAELAPDGAFQSEVEVPSVFPDGRATVFLVNWEVVDWCPGYALAQASTEGRSSASCASYAATVMIDRDR